MKTMTLYRPSALHGFFERQNGMSDFDRLFDTLLGDSPMAPARKAFDHLPAVDIRETEKAYLLEMELPGCDEKDIEIHVDGLNLSIASKKEEVKEEKQEPEGEQDAKKDQGTWLLKERRMSSFSRTFRLPENANPEEVTAEFKNGVLSMEINKRAEAQKRTIPINLGAERRGQT